MKHERSKDSEPYRLEDIQKYILGALGVQPRCTTQQQELFVAEKYSVVCLICSDSDSDLNSDVESRSNDCDPGLNRIADAKQNDDGDVVYHRHDHRVELARDDAIPRVHASLLLQKNPLVDSRKMRKKFRKKTRHIDLLGSKIAEHDLSAFVLSPSQVDDLYSTSSSSSSSSFLFKYPKLLSFRSLQDAQNPAAAAAAPAAASSSSSQPPTLLAIDCEMCRTSRGLECTRVTLVDETCAVVYDAYVVPPEPILDYLTEYSGITAERMDKCVKTLADVQHDLMQIVDKNTVLVGHSIENDLHAIGVHHTRIIDTSLLYLQPHKHSKGRHAGRVSLKKLSMLYLGESIQTGSEGHCSAEDAAAAMKLAKLRMLLGDKLRFNLCGPANVPLIQTLEDRRIECVMIDSAVNCQTYCHGSVITIPAATAEKATETLCKRLKALTAHESTTRFTWAHVPGLPRERVQALVNKCRDVMPRNTVLLCVVAPCTAALEQLHRVRTARDVVWSTSLQMQLNHVAAQTQSGTFVVLVKA